jgi:hypothetical protein
MGKINISRTLKLLLPLSAIVVMLVLTGCRSPESVTLPQTMYAPAFSYVNTFITETGNSASGATVQFSVRIAERIDTFNVKIIFYYDVTPPTTLGQPAYSEPGTYIVKEAIEEPVIWKNVPPGSHVFSAQLVNAQDNTPTDPPVIAQCIITVPAEVSEAPEIRIASVQVPYPIAEYVTMSPEPIPPLEAGVTASVHNIKLNDDNIGKQNVPGEGHIIYYLDVDPPTVPGQSAITGPGTFKATTSDFYFWEELPADRHVFSIQLVNNDNTPLDPPVTAQIIITIPSKL